LFVVPAGALMEAFIAFFGLNRQISTSHQPKPNVLPAWDGSKTALAGSKAALAGSKTALAGRKLLWPAVNPALAGVKWLAYPKPALAEPRYRPVPQQASHQPCQSPDHTVCSLSLSPAQVTEAERRAARLQQEGAKLRAVLAQEVP
jgi:hypothetical protein